MKFYILVITIMCISCNYTEICYLDSPQKKSRLIFEWVGTLIPNDQAYIRIYPKGFKHNSISIRPMMDLSIHIYWGDTIKIRGGVLVDDTSSVVINSQINWKRNYSSLEEQEVKNNMPNWGHYYLSRIANGYYENHPSE